MSDDRDHPRPSAPYAEETAQATFHAPALSPAPGDPTLAIALSRAEIDSQIATARAFPRDLRRAADRMLQMATYNPAIAEDCIYSLPRGGKQIRGPSIRFAEILRHNWGNSRDASHVTFVDRIERNVECEAVYHDLETNVATTSTVRRTIELKKGKQAIDLDMIQLAGAAGMSIARRNAILGGIPRFVWQPILDQVERVIRGDEKTLAERRDRAIAYFAKAGVGIERVLKALDKAQAEDINLDDLVMMTGWRTAITQGDSSLDEIFPEERKAPAKASLAEQLDALAADPNAPADAPPAADVGEAAAAAKHTAASPPNSEGASSNAPEGAKAAVGTPQPSTAAEAPRSNQQAAIKPPSAPSYDQAMAAPANGKTAAQAAPKLGGMPSERRARLAAKGEEVAAKGHDRLMEWLDNLAGDEVALITPSMEQRWKAIAEQKPG